MLNVLLYSQNSVQEEPSKLLSWHPQVEVCAHAHKQEFSSCNAVVLAMPCQTFIARL